MLQFRAICARESVLGLPIPPRAQQSWMLFHIARVISRPIVTDITYLPGISDILYLYNICTQ